MTLHISTLIEELSVLPEQNSATMRLLQLLESPDSGTRDVGAVIEADPSMTTRLLALANSAFFSTRAPVTNAWGAVMVVGYNVVRALVAAGSLGLSRVDGEMPKGYFEHSVASAAGASVVAKAVGLRASDAFSAGMIHDVGGALLFRANRAKWQETAVLENGQLHSTLRGEQQSFGAHHDELGAQVLEYLHFPESIVDIVRSHNQPAFLADVQLTRVVIAGIALAEANGVLSTSDSIADPHDAFESIGLEFPGTPEMTAAFSTEIDDLTALLR